MRSQSEVFRRAGGFLLLSAFLAAVSLRGQTNVNVRIMAANLNGNTQSYQPFAIRIFQGLKPDVVCIQEFNYNNNTPADFRLMVDTAFGTNFVYYREPHTGSGDIPNGVISRYPILNSGSWTDTEVGNRGFAWARIDLPGSNDLYVVSVHLLTSSATERGIEAANLKALIQANFPSNAWIVVGGDFNTDSRTESPTMTTFDSYLSDYPIPVDNNGNSDTSQNRNHPHDYVLPSFSLTNIETASVFPSHSFPSGLVFDSTVYTPLSDVSPVLYGDSTNAQHMAVLKDFLIPFSGTNIGSLPFITVQPRGLAVVQGDDATFSVTANSASSLTYQWQFNNTNILDATTNFYTVTNAQPADAGIYSVILSNSAGGITSSNAVLTVATSPLITTNPASQTVNEGDNATFTVSAIGIAPLFYQWRFNGTNINDATANFYTVTNAQAVSEGAYSVIVTNFSGSATSTVASLTVNGVITGTPVTLAGWDMSGLSNYGPSPMPASTNAPALTVGGLTRGSGVTTLNTAAARTWGGNNFNSASVDAAVTANQYATFSISANAGYQVSFTSLSKYDYKRSNAGPPNGVLQIQVGAGAFTNIASFSYTSTSGASLGPVDLSAIAALQNVAASNIVTFRIVNYGATSSGGNWYIFDLASSTAPDLAVEGIITSTASSTNAPAELSAPGLNAGQFQMLVTGTEGSDYVVQTSTNLAAPDWVPVLTNTSPFTFTDTNLDDAQKFYRAISMP